MIGRLLTFRRRQEWSNVPDEELVLGSARGDATAVEELFRRHGDRVYRLLVRLRGVDAKEIEDLVQSTFLEMQKSARHFENRASVGAWILGIALNIRRHHLRSEARRRAFMEAVAPLVSRADQRDPHEQFAERQALGRLEAAIAALPERLRTVVILTDVEGLKGREAARVLGVPEGTVWRRLHEARSRLRALIGEKEEDDR